LATPIGKKRKSGETGNSGLTGNISSTLKESDLKKEVEEFLDDKRKKKKLSEYTELELAVISGLLARGVRARDPKADLKYVLEHLEDD
jgi:hypothetical protein